MKYLITITDSKNNIIFTGKPITLPLTNSSIKSKSIELFSDPEPCIIHQSYASQKIVDSFISMFPVLPVRKLSLKAYKDKLSFLNIKQLETCFLTIEVIKK